MGRLSPAATIGLGRTMVLVWAADKVAASGNTLSRTAVLTRRKRRFTGESVLAKLANTSSSCITRGWRNISARPFGARRRVKRWRNKLARISSSSMICGSCGTGSGALGFATRGISADNFSTFARARSRVRTKAGSSKSITGKSAAGLLSGFTPLDANERASTTFIACTGAGVSATMGTACTVGIDARLTEEWVRRVAADEFCWSVCCWALIFCISANHTRSRWLRNTVNKIISPTNVTTINIHHITRLTLYL